MTAAVTPVRASRWSRAMRHPSLLIGAALTCLLGLVALLSIVWTPHAFDAVAITERMQGPSAAHWLGTDHFGRDIATRLMIGARNSILVGVVAVGIGLAVGGALGVLAAARGGWVDEIVTRGSDVVFAFPAIVSAILITAIFGPGAVNAIIAIGILCV